MYVIASRYSLYCRTRVGFCTRFRTHDVSKSAFDSQWAYTGSASDSEMGSTRTAAPGLFRQAALKRCKMCA